MITFSITLFPLRQIPRPPR